MALPFDKLDQTRLPALPGSVRVGGLALATTPNEASLGCLFRGAVSVSAATVQIDSQPESPACKKGSATGKVSAREDRIVASVAGCKI
jgi:hypothetical protein